MFKQKNITKQTIPLNIKIKIWKENHHISDSCLSQCQYNNCGKILRCPLSIRKYFDIHNELKGCKYILYPNAEFGHIKSEKNGGKATYENLIIQCKECNTKLGSKNITNVCIGDALMINNNNHINNTLDFMDIESKYCLVYTSKGKQCKNKASFSNGTCSIHSGLIF